MRSWPHSHIAAVVGVAGGGHARGRPADRGGAGQRGPPCGACSFDKGFHSPANRARLDALLPDGNVLPQKGRLGNAAKAKELEPAFVSARRRHPSVESGINHLQHHDLARVRTKGAEGFARTAALSVVATNLHTVGVLLQRRERHALWTRCHAIRNGKRRRRAA